MVQYLKYIARTIGLKAIYTQLQYFFLKWRGFHLLTVDQTNAFMAAHQVKAVPGNKVELPEIVNCADASTVIFAAKQSLTDPVYVWEYRAAAGKKIEMSKYGSVIVEQKVLCTDWNHSSFYKDIWKADTRPKKAVPTLIALFSQFQDGVFYGGYYDFVFLVATKIARIKAAFPHHDFSDAVISYPLFNASYEQDYLKLMDIDTANLIDSSQYRITSQRILAGNSAHWYPNLADIICLKQLVAQKFKLVKTAPCRIYVSRSGRRRIVNEAELITMLKKFDFVIIADVPRSVTEQIAIYYNAEFILGPHGASFSNIIWCQPGAHLLELFSRNYAPDFFLYLARLTGIKYSAFYDGVPDKAVKYLDGLVEDIFIPVPLLESCLEGIFRHDQV